MGDCTGLKGRVSVLGLWILEVIMLKRTVGEVSLLGTIYDCTNCTLLFRKAHVIRTRKKTFYPYPCVRNAGLTDDW